MSGRGWMERQTRERITRIVAMAELGVSKSGAAEALGMDNNALNDLLTRWCGHCMWPPMFDADIFDLPVRDLNHASRAGIKLGPRALPRVEPRTEPQNDWEKLRPPSREPCGFCGVRADVHDEFGCKRWRVAVI